MNKILHILLAFLFSLTIISCGSDDGGSSASTDNSSSTTTTIVAFGNAQFGKVKFQQKRNYEEKHTDRTSIHFVVLPYKFNGV